MMPPYPFFGFPPFRRPMPYVPPYNNVHNSSSNFVNSKQKPYNPNTPNKVCKENFDNCSTNNVEEDSDKCFEIFGIKLYFDDLLILTLLFFLYQEDVKDTYLYMALILLLLS